MTTEEPANPDPSSEPAAPPASAGSSPELLLMIGALLVVGVYVVFELLLGEYFQTGLTLVAAAFVLILPRVDRSATERIAPMPVILKGLGYVVAASGLLEVLSELRFGQLDDALEIVGALIAYAGYALAFVGARGLKA